MGLRKRTAASLIAGTLLALFWLPSVAHAAPSVLASDPEDGETIHGPAPDEVTITFDMPLDPSASGLIVVDECGRRVDGDDASVFGNQISVSITKKPSGEYEAQYKATPPAGATGSSSGTISFTVHSGQSCGKSTHSGHGNHGGNEEPGEGNSGHSGHGSGGGSHGGGHSGDESSHDSGSHDSGSHDSGSSGGHTSAGHDTMDHSGSSDGGHNGHNDKDKGHGNHSGGGGGTSAAPQFAAPDLPSLGGTTVPASTIATSLGLCLLMGLAGGWVVRNGGL